MSAGAGAPFITTIAAMLKPRRLRLDGTLGGAGSEQHENLGFETERSEVS